MRCLAALVPQASSDVEIIVADNNSDADLGKVRATFPDVTIVVQPEKGAGLARNRGVEESRGAILMFIDADCVPAPDWIARGRSIVKPDTVIGGRVDVFHETEPPLTGAQAFEAVFAFKMKRYLTEKSFLGAGNLTLPKEAFLRTGGFRAAVSEDVEWSRRALEANVDLEFDESLAVGHQSRNDWDALQRKWRRLTTETFLLSIDSPIKRAEWFVLALAMPASAIWHTPRIFRRTDLSWRERAAATVTLFRLRGIRMLWMMRQSLTGEA